MIRKIFKNKQTKTNSKIDNLLEKYNIPRSYLNVNRRMVVRAVGVGLFWGFIPMPMQMLAVLFTMSFFRFNVPIAISMVWLSNPLTMPFMYYMEYQTGNMILFQEGLVGVDLSVEWFVGNFDKIILPLYVGTFFYSVVVNLLVCLSINQLWKNSVLIERKTKRKTDNNL